MRNLLDLDYFQTFFSIMSMNSVSYLSLSPSLLLQTPQHRAAVHVIAVMSLLSASFFGRNNIEEYMWRGDGGGTGRDTRKTH